jgi:sugar diacid utilization regulator
MNIQSAARALGKHPNTLYARLERIHAACGRDGLRFHDLSEMLLAADCYGVPARLE